MITYKYKPGALTLFLLYWGPFFHSVSKYAKISRLSQMCPKMRHFGLLCYKIVELNSTRDILDFYHLRNLYVQQSITDRNVIHFANMSRILFACTENDRTRNALALLLVVCLCWSFLFSEAAEVFFRWPRIHAISQSERHIITVF